MDTKRHKCPTGHTDTGNVPTQHDKTKAGAISARFFYTLTMSKNVIHDEKMHFLCGWTERPQSYSANEQRANGFGRA